MTVTSAPDVVCTRWADSFLFSSLLLASGCSLLCIEGALLIIRWHSIVPCNF